MKYKKRRPARGRSEPSASQFETQSSYHLGQEPGFILLDRGFFDANPMAVAFRRDSIDGEVIKPGLTLKAGECLVLVVRRLEGHLRMLLEPSDELRTRLDAGNPEGSVVYGCGCNTERTELSPELLEELLNMGSRREP